MCFEYIINGPDMLEPDAFAQQHRHDTRCTVRTICTCHIGTVLPKVARSSGMYIRILY